MKSKIYVTILCAVLCVLSCSEEQAVVYNYMRFKRDGGGHIEFKIYQTSNPEKLKVVVNKYNFRDTTIQFEISKDSALSKAVTAFQNALNNNVSITGDFKQPTLPTGTWSYMYLGNNSIENEITNSNLRNSLEPLENQIRDNIK
jgi:hypothetical protein